MVNGHSHFCQKQANNTIYIMISTLNGTFRLVFYLYCDFSCCCCFPADVQSRNNDLYVVNSSVGNRIFCLVLYTYRDFSVCLFFPPTDVQSGNNDLYVVNSSVGKASDRHVGDAGSIPWCGKGFVSQS